MNNKKQSFVILLLCLLGFLLITINLNGPMIQSLDNQIYSFIISFKSPLLTKFFTFFTQISSVKGTIIMVTISLAFFKGLRNKIINIFCSSLSALLNHGIKIIIKRSRPELTRRLVKEVGYSFPSGHSMAAFTLYGYFIYLTSKSELDKKYKYLIYLLNVVYIIFLGISRIYLGVHYPSDVIAGFLMSFSYLILFTSVIEKYNDNN